MEQLGVWGLVDGSFQPLVKSDLDFSAHLEEWLVLTPTLLWPELTIVGRQIQLGSERLELLALDSHGRWTIVKVAPGPLNRNQLALALQHAAYLSNLPFAELVEQIDAYLGRQRGNQAGSLAQLLAERQLTTEMLDYGREIQIILVGTGQDRDIAQLIAYLCERYHLPLYAAVYTLYENGQSQSFLVREFMERTLRPLPRQAPVQEQDSTTPMVISRPDNSGNPPPAAPNSLSPASNTASDAMTLDSPQRATASETPHRPSGVLRKTPNPPSSTLSSSSWQLAVDGLRKQAEELWEWSRERLGLPPADLLSSFEQHGLAAESLRVADANEIGDLLRHLLVMADRRRLRLTFNEGWVQFAAAHLPERALFTARTRANKPGRLPLHLHFEALAAAFNRSPDELYQILGRHDLYHLTADDLHKFVHAFQSLTRKN